MEDANILTSDAGIRTALVRNVAGALVRGRVLRGHDDGQVTVEWAGLKITARPLALPITEEREQA